MEAGFAGVDDAIKEQSFHFEGVEIAQGGFDEFAALDFNAGVDELFAVGDGHGECHAGFEFLAAEFHEGADDVEGAAGDFGFFGDDGVFDEVAFRVIDAFAIAVKGDGGFLAAGAFFGAEEGGQGAAALIEVGGVIVFDADDFIDEALGFQVDVKLARAGGAGEPFEIDFTGFDEAPFGAELHFDGLAQCVVLRRKEGNGGQECKGCFQSGSPDEFLCNSISIRLHWAAGGGGQNRMRISGARKH